MKISQWEKLFSSWDVPTLEKNYKAIGSISIAIADKFEGLEAIRALIKFELKSRGVEM